jgi:hypothetical protein
MGVGAAADLPLGPLKSRKIFQKFFKKISKKFSQIAFGLFLFALLAINPKSPEMDQIWSLR